MEAHTRAVQRFDHARSWKGFSIERETGWFDQSPIHKEEEKDVAPTDRPHREQRETLQSILKSQNNMYRKYYGTASRICRRVLNGNRNKFCLFFLE